MMLTGGPNGARVSRGWLVLTGLVLWMVVVQSPVRRSANAQIPEKRHLGLRIKLTAGPPEHRTREVEGSYGQAIKREFLTIVDEALAADLFQIEVRTRVSQSHASRPITVRDPSPPRDALSVQVYAYYRSHPKSLVGSYMVLEGKSIRPPELATLGVEPFEMTAFNAIPIVISRDEHPALKNITRSLEVVRLERTFGRYHLFLKNAYGQDVLNYALVFPDGVFSKELFPNPGYRYLLGEVQPRIPPGDVSEVAFGSGSPVDGEVAIVAVILRDGSTDGDPAVCASLVAGYIGAGFAARTILARTQLSVDASDDDILAKLGRAEAQLGSMPENLDKETGMKLLRTRFSSYDDQFLSNLLVPLNKGYNRVRTLYPQTLTFLLRDPRVPESVAVDKAQRISELRFRLRYILTELQI